MFFHEPVKKVVAQPQPREVREVGQYKSIAADGSIEVVKKKIVIYDSPVPCIAEANREAAEQRQAKNKHQDVAFGNATCLPSEKEKKSTAKEDLRKSFEEQIAQRRQEMERRKEDERKEEKRQLEERLRKAQERDAFDKRRVEALKQEARKGLECSTPRKRKDCDSSSAFFLDDSAVVSRSKAIRNDTYESMRKQIEERARAKAAAQDKQKRDAIEQSKKTQQELAAQRQAEMLAKQASRQKTADEFTRSLTQYRKDKEEAAAREKEMDRKFVNQKLKEEAAAIAREEAKRAEKKVNMGSPPNRDNASKASKETRVIERDETTVLMRCPKSGRLLPPTQFNVVHHRN